MNPKSVGARGFSLIELLLALAIFSTIAATLSGIFSAGISLWKRWGSSSQMEQEARAILLRMNRELQNALPYKGSFSGTANQISFFTGWDDPSRQQTDADWNPEHRLVQFTYRLTLDPVAGRALEKEQRIFLNRDADGNKSYRTQTITSYPTDFSLEYGFRQGSPGAATILWKDSAHVFPTAIKIHLMLQETPRSPALDLTEVVELMIS